jgi:membrane protease YdiL (CAAX protease family)
VIAAVLVVIVSQVVFQDLVLADMVAQGVDVTSLEAQQPLWWQSLLASFYGGITEEIQLRLFLLSLLAWIGSRIWRDDHGRPVVGVLWGATILSAIVFGLGHLPALSSMGLSITPILLTSTVVQNGVGGVILGWLYWRWGLESAVISHFTADIVILVILPLLVSMSG